MFHLPPGIHFCKQQDFGAENLFIRFLSTLQLTICAALDSKKVSIPLNSTSCHSSIKKNAFRALVTGLSIRLKRSRLTSLVRGSKSTNLGLWQPLNFRPRNGAPKKTHKKCSHRHFTLLTLWDDIQHFSNKIFLPNKFLGSTFLLNSLWIHLLEDFRKLTGLRVSTKELLELVACTFAHAQ